MRDGVGVDDDPADTTGVHRTTSRRWNRKMTGATTGQPLRNLLFMMTVPSRSLSLLASLTGPKTSIVWKLTFVKR